MAESDALAAIISDLEAALDAVNIEGHETAEDMIRDAMRRVVKVIDQNKAFLELAADDVQANNGASLAAISTRIIPKALALMDRIKATGQLRPVPDVIFARTMVAMLMGFIISEQAMPQMARMAMRMFPQRAWLDGMVDLMLYGVLEDDAR